MEMELKYGKLIRMEVAIKYNLGYYEKCRERVKHKTFI